MCIRDSLPGDAYQTPPAGAGAGAEGAQAEAPPSPVSLAPGGFATTGDDRSGPDVEGVDLAEATVPAEAPDLGAGPPDTQAVEVPSHMRVDQSESIKTTNPYTLDSDTTHARTLDEHSQVQVETRTHTLASRAEPPSLTLIPRKQPLRHIMQQTNILVKESGNHVIVHEMSH